MTRTAAGGVIRWDPHFVLSHPAIDGQHQTMVGLANRILDAERRGAKEELVAAVRELINQSAEHFLFEERLMAETGYQRADAHGEHHGQVLAQLHRFCERMMAGAYDHAAEKTAEFLRGWFTTHLNDFDRHLAEHLAGLSARGSAADRPA